MMPKMDGWQVCREIRVNSKCADHHADSRGDGGRTAGISAGSGQVYFQALQSQDSGGPKWKRPAQSKSRLGREEALTCSGITVDKAAHRVIIEMEKILDLSYKRFELLTYFMENKGIALSEKRS